MALTACAAVLLALGRWLRRYDAAVILGVDAAAAVVSLAALWAALSDGSPLRRAVPLMALAAVVGLFPALMRNLSLVFPFPALIVSTAAILFLSLLWVRRCGYRLAKSRRSGAALL
jgi:hypothetical protein